MNNKLLWIGAVILGITAFNAAKDICGKKETGNASETQELRERANEYNQDEADRIIRAERRGKLEDAARQKANQERVEFEKELRRRRWNGL